ncbi:MAG TPA: hypothetical protein G4N95_04840 [Anaerolineae bacterium]|nr:hypothetical protein [Anaerolineae bacterium]
MLSLRAECNVAKQSPSPPSSSLRGGAADKVISSIENKHTMALCMPRREIASTPSGGLAMTEDVVTANGV